VRCIAATATVIITVLSAVKPYFTPSFPVATVSAPQNSSNVFVIDLKQYTYCDDAVYGRGPFSYQLVNFRDTFVVNSSTGWVQTATILNRSSVGQYDVNVTVSIQGLPASASLLRFMVRFCVRRLTCDSFTLVFVMARLFDPFS
jgi:hypothetical protein